MLSRENEELKKIDGFVRDADVAQRQRRVQKEDPSDASHEGNEHGIKKMSCNKRMDSTCTMVEMLF